MKADSCRLLQTPADFAGVCRSPYVTFLWHTGVCRSLQEYVGECKVLQTSRMMFKYVDPATLQVVPAPKPSDTSRKCKAADQGDNNNSRGRRAPRTCIVCHSTTCPGRWSSSKCSTSQPPADPGSSLSLWGGHFTLFWSYHSSYTFCSSYILGLL
jgi:hypothetical protein